VLRLLKQYYPIRNAIFVIGEGIVIYLSVLLACGILLSTELLHPSYQLTLKILLITITCQICLYYNDLYNLRVVDSYTELGIRLLQSLGVAAIVLAGVYTVFPDAIIGRGIFIVSIAIVILLIVSWRFCYNIVINKGLFNQKIILLGSGDFADLIVEKIESKKDCGYSIQLRLYEYPNRQAEGVAGPSNGQLSTSSYSGLYEQAVELNTDKIVVALKERRGGVYVRELLRSRVSGVDVIEGTSFFEMLTGRLYVELTNPGWFIFSEGFKKSPLKVVAKRMFDILVSTTMLLMLTPVIVIVALLIKIDSKGPIFFSQERVGHNRNPYRVHKFRSMVTDAEVKSGPVWAQDEDPRVTKIGKLIRKWRIDEIPQLWNVLKGEMSFVGPRPEREHFVKQLEEQIPYYGVRFSVKPGLTGWAQVSYGYGASVQDAIEKLNYDLFYIKNMSLLLDIVIFIRTVKTVIFGVGAR